MLVLSVLGFFFDSLPLIIISFVGILGSFLLMSREAVFESAPAVITRPVVLGLPPEELESNQLTPDMMGMGFLPDPVGHSKFDPFGHIPGNIRQMLPFPNYGKTSPIERLFFGVPFIGSYLFNFLKGKN